MLPAAPGTEGTGKFWGSFGLFLSLPTSVSGGIGICRKDITLCWHPAATSLEKGFGKRCLGMEVVGKGLPKSSRGGKQNPPRSLRAMNSFLCFMSLGERKHKAETSAFLSPLCENNLEMLLLDEARGGKAACFPGLASHYSGALRTQSDLFIPEFNLAINAQLCCWQTQPLDLSTRFLPQTTASSKERGLTYFKKNTF